jgi:hypothetical protein
MDPGHAGHRKEAAWAVLRKHLQHQLPEHLQEYLHVHL